MAKKHVLEDAIAVSGRSWLAEGVFNGVQEQHDVRSVAVSNEIRLALVIGNSNYINLPKLSNPVNDARAISEILKKLGYKTRLLIDASEQNIRREVRQFASDSDKADVALVFFAGHGAQVNGNNYLLPTELFCG